MEEKLKSISKQIHWSLLLRAAAFALAWLWLPIWLFCLIALGLYFTPLFQARKLAPPFFILLLLGILQPATLFFAVIFGAVFYGILLIKDLIVIDRRPAYEMVVLVLSILMFRSLYLQFQNGIQAPAVIWSFIAAAAFAWLLDSFMRGFEADPENTAQENPLRRTASWLSFLLMWQMLLIGLFLPLDFIYQSAGAFLVAVVLVEFIPEYIAGTLSHAKLLATSGLVCGLFAVVLGSAHWGL